MSMNDLPQGEKYIRSHRFHKRWHKVLMVLGSVVVFCTTYALILPAITMERGCQIPEHTHTDACYTQVSSVRKMIPVCTSETLELHQHTADCYDADGEVSCGYADFVVHTHDAACYDENGELWCPLPEIRTHEHTEACYAQAGGELICGYDETDGSEGHTHDESCYGEDGELQCSLPESEAVEAHHHTDDCYAEEHSELSCVRAEVILHRHVATCYDENGSLICGKMQVLQHQHSDACFRETEVSADTDVLTCTNTGENHVHTARCYGTWVLSCGLEEHAHTNVCYTSEDDTVEGEAALYDADGTLNVSLLYGDQAPQSQYPDGIFYYTHTNMSGYLKLEPIGLEEDLTDVTVTLSIPKQYVEKESINIPDFNTNSSATEYEILPVEEDTENYYARIHFTTYDKTQTLVLPFVLSFWDDVVPDNYRLPVTASISGGNTTEPSIYKPQYKLWEITKYVNSNRHREFAMDGAEVVVTPLEEGGNPYLDDLTYVDFAFIVNGCTYEGSNLSDWRDVCEVTLTDQLPEYTDKDGMTRIAVFDADKNPGWTLSADGTSVSRTYQGTRSGDVLTQIYNDKLSLRFPGLKFETTADALIADLANRVHLIAVPSNAAEDETHPEADDSLRFRITSDPSTSGRFSKWATKGDIYDVDSYKTNPYPWRVSLHNDQKKTTPLRHIVIQDREITENGETVLQGLDEALKFVRLESDGHSALASGQTFADIIDKIVAYYTDGSTQEYTVTTSDLNAYGHFSITFDESKVCNGYEIIFRDDYAMQHGEGVEFQIYTVYRDPEHTHVPDGTEKVTYTNEARSVNSYPIGDQTVFVYLKQEGRYDMLPSTEELRVTKKTLVNDGSSTWDGIGGNTVGSTYCYLIQLSGSLLEPEVKEYKDIRVVDLLPDGVHYEKIHLVQQDFSVGSILDGGRDYQPEIIENYHNSGRTAVIFHLNVENLRKTVKTQADIYFGVTIDQNAHPGTVRNDVYVVGDNLDEYQGKTGGAEDIYDLNNNGRTDDRIAYGFSDATIIASLSTYAEKFIAPAGTDSWSKQGLLVKTGADFDYLLRITNETKAEYHGLVVYDTLPRVGDKNLFGTQNRNSEFDVYLREAITPPEGYSVFYTTSTDVYQKSMTELVNADIWMEDVSDYAAVTAFKIVAGEGTVLNGESKFEVRIPARAPSQLDDVSMTKLQGKTPQDQTTGTATWLEANNSFGFQTNESPSAKESNTVWARIPFAGFCVKKVDGTNDNALPGAEFELTDAEGQVIAAAVSGEDGLFSFRDLTEGTYTLTETRVPDGYMDRTLSITVTITQNPVTMEYSISFGDLYAGIGSSADPLCLPNYTTPVLPATGGAGTNLYTTGGALLMVAAACLLYIQNKRRKGAQISD